jgi:predicted methyltransferase
MKTIRPIVSGLLVLACAGAPTAAPVSSAPSPPPSAVAAAPALGPADPKAVAEAAVAAADRSPEDRALDAGRKPAAMLAFFGIAPGMKVADLAAGGGYTTELIARVVGDTGSVYGQNAKVILERFAEKPWSARLAKPVMKGVVRIDSDFDEPLPPEVKDLDVVTFVLFYHDTVWLKADRARLNRNVFRALKSGGVYGIVDHSARAGDGTSVSETLHRIEESVLKDEVLKAGFVLDAEADFLREPSDTRDWSASPRTAGERRGHSDRFVLRFKKP